MPTLNVTITRVAFPPATSDPDTWYILVTDHGTAKGCMSWRPQDSEALILEGEWTTWHGSREFAFKTARIDVPTNPRDMLHYTISRTKGAGPALEAMIWDAMGENWQAIPDGKIPRLSGRVYQEFLLQIEALQSKTEEVRVIAALMGKGATVNMASKAWEMWKKETLGVVNADCYRLAELEGYSFRDVDLKIRHGYGIADDDKRRIRAAVIYSLRKITDAGDTVAEWNSLFTQAIGLLGGYADLISDCTSELFEEGTLKAFPKSEGVSLAADWKAETTIWDFVSGNNSTPRPRLLAEQTGRGLGRDAGAGNDNQQSGGKS